MISALRSLALRSPARLQLYHGAASLFTLRLVQLVAGLAATYFLARSMNKDAFGEYNMVLNAIGVLTVFALSGLNNSLMQAVARGHAGTYRATVPLAFGSSFLGSAVLLGMCGWYYHYGQGQQQLAQGLLLAAMIFPFTHGLVQWKSVIMGHGRFGQLLVHDGICSVITYGLIIAAVQLYPGYYVYPIVLSLLVPAVYNVSLTLATYRQMPPDASVEAHNVRYGISTTVYSSLGAIGSNLDRLVLFYFLSPAALAIFVAAGRIPDILSGAMQDVSAVLAPRLAKYESYTKRLDQMFTVLSWILGCAVVVFAFTAIPYLVTMLFGRNYADAVPYAQALTCSVAVGYLANLRFRYIRSQADARSFRDITLISSAVRLAAFLALVPPFGLMGAVVAIFVYRFALIAVVRIAIRRHFTAAT